MSDPDKIGDKGVGILKVHKLDSKRHILGRNSIPLMFQAIVQKGAQPQYIKYQDLKKRYPHILFRFFEEKMKIHNISQHQNNIAPQTNQRHDKLALDKQYQQQTSRHSLVREDSKSKDSDSQWTTGNTRKSESHVNTSRGKLQVRITSNKSSRAFQPNTISHKRFHKQDGTYVKSYNNQRQSKNGASKGREAQQQSKYLKIVGNGLEYDEAYMKLKYDYEGYYDRVISKGILDTKNLPPRVYQAQLAAKLKMQKSKSKSKSKGKSKLKRSNNRK